MSSKNMNIQKGHDRKGSEGNIHGFYIKRTEIPFKRNADVM